MEPSTNTSSMDCQRILVSDFDGTITKHDFYDLASRAFPEIRGDHWEKYETGEITHFEALRRIFAAIRAPEEQLIEIAKAMEPQKDMAGLLTKLSASGWRVKVASAGCDWYIKRILADVLDRLEIHSNPAAYAPGGGLIMEAPKGSPFYCPELGVNKVAIVRAALKSARTVAFAGDGRPDLPAALQVPGNLRFARNRLARMLQEIGEEYQPFERWAEVVEKLSSFREQSQVNK